MTSSAAATSAKIFANLLRSSKFITQGDFRNSLVIGKVFHTTQDDLYVDVGMKFHAVVKKPQQNRHLYVRNSTVKLKLLDYEITDKFIGADSVSTMLEMDAILLGLESSPIATKQAGPVSSSDRASKPQTSPAQGWSSSLKPHAI